MVLKSHQSDMTELIKWIGSPNESGPSSPNFLQRDAFFYNKCAIGPMILNVGDFVLVSNADASEPDTVEGCDIAKILHLYELQEKSNRDPYRAIVQWYSRPQSIPAKYVNKDELCFDFERELIEEHRSYDSDISLETIFRKCSVLYGTVDTSASGLLGHSNRKNNSCPTFICRYKFIRIKEKYQLLPLEFENAESNSVRRSRRKHVDPKNESAKKARRSTVISENARMHRDSPSVINPTELIDLNYYNDQKVSPIKIVERRRIVSSTANDRFSTPTSRKTATIKGSPLSEQNIKVTPTIKALKARRNLNSSLEHVVNDTNDSDCLNYSIIKNTPDAQKPTNEMKIKLRVSERHRLVSTEKDPLALENNTKEFIDFIEAHTNDLYETPTKKLKESATETPNNKRKSILKSATTRIGTPKRSIHMSNVVEELVFDKREILSTPTLKSKKSLIFNKEEEDIEKILQRVTPKKPAEKTPKRGRRSNSNYLKDSETPKTPKTPKTPSQKLKMLRSGELTPSFKEREKIDQSKSTKNILQLARECLHVSAVPLSLPCREKEFENIYTFLEDKIKDQCGGCMYISGVPGTGKTATVTGVIRALQKQVQEEALPTFDYLEINGMRLTEPRQAYVHIYRQLTGKTVTWEHAHTLLEKRFTTTSPRRMTTVLLVDELDILCNRRQDVVYNLLDWPTKTTARLVVITIANTMDLPERLLMSKVTSRLGLTRLTFQPYSHKQLQEIVTTRLSGSEAFKSEAIQLVARKVAAVSGDARRALDICRRATEIADSSKDKEICVNLLHVQQALSEMIASAKVQAIKNCSRLEQILLQAIAAEVARTGIEETFFMGVYAQLENIAHYSGGVLIPTIGQVLRLCSKLGAQRLIICEHSRNDIFQKILLNVSMDDIHYALKVTSDATTIFL
uniref:Origin recognition complex subunit 1 n=1 Tax=Glossina brevipalpis TaxID=37001 RepID=A0A1A9X3S8_9MUSC